MKEMLEFVSWQWSKWETWQKGYVVCAFLLGVGVMAPSPYDRYLFAVPMIALFVWTGKWCVWDQIKASWNKYQTEKQQLFPSIKDSHK